MYRGIIFAIAGLVFASGCGSSAPGSGPSERATNTGAHLWREFRFRNGMSSDDVIREVGLPIRYDHVDGFVCFIYPLEHTRELRLNFIQLQSGGFSALISAETKAYYKGKLLWWRVFTGDPDAPHPTYLEARD